MYVVVVPDSSVVEILGGSYYNVKVEKESVLYRLEEMGCVYRSIFRVSPPVEYAYIVEPRCHIGYTRYIDVLKPTYDVILYDLFGRDEDELRKLIDMGVVRGYRVEDARVGTAVSIDTHLSFTALLEIVELAGVIDVRGLRNLIEPWGR